MIRLSLPTVLTLAFAGTAFAQEAATPTAVPPLPPAVDCTVPANMLSQACIGLDRIADFAPIAAPVVAGAVVIALIAGGSDDDNDAAIPATGTGSTSGTN